MYVRLLLGDFGMLEHLMTQQGSGDKSAQQLAQSITFLGASFFMLLETSLKDPQTSFSQRS